MTDAGSIVGPANSPGANPGAAPPPQLAAQPSHFPAEGFWAVIYRRSRYTVAIVLSGAMFSTWGWQLAAPVPEWGGVSLLAWGNHGLVTALGLSLMLLLATAVCSLLVHPDSPHMGLFCALLGMAGLAIRGGSIRSLIVYGQMRNMQPAIAQALALECVQWTLLFLVAEVFTRLLHDRLLSNLHWITRSGSVAAAAAAQQGVPGSAPVGVSLAVSKFLRTRGLPRPIATPLALVYSGFLAFLLLIVFMQTQLKGQVLVACFVSFFLSTLAAYLAFPRVLALALFLAVPLTAAGGYLYGMNLPCPYPGQTGFVMMRALPIDYMSAGIPGAILGYYVGLLWALHSAEEDA